MHGYKTPEYIKLLSPPKCCHVIIPNLMDVAVVMDRITGSPSTDLLHSMLYCWIHHLIKIKMKWLIVPVVCIIFVSVSLSTGR